MSWAKRGLPPPDPVRFFASKEAVYGIIEVKIPAHSVKTGQARRAFTDSRDFPVSAKMRIAGQECPAYRFFGIAAFIPAHRAGHSAAFS
jgi:hypothetical protein